MSIPQKISAKISHATKYLTGNIGYIPGPDKKFNVCITFDGGFVNNYKHALPLYATITLMV